jgi:hypothetical protein
MNSIIRLQEEIKLHSNSGQGQSWLGIRISEHLISYVVRGVGEVVNSAQSHQTPASARISDIEDLALFRQLPTSPGFDVCVGDGCGEVYG